MVLIRLEDSTIAKARNTCEGHPSSRALVKGGSTLVLCGVCYMNMAVKPHVSDGHSVLGQSSGLVRADGGGRSKSLHSFKILHQAVLLCHTFGSQSQTHLCE